MPHRVLVLGASGMAGHVIVSRLRERGFDVLTTQNLHPVQGAISFSATDIDEYDRVFDRIDVDAIINCVGVLVSASAKDPMRAKLANTFLPKYLEATFRTRATKIIHISTDCVYDGTAGPYHVSEPPTEVSMYGLTKALGEISNTKDVTIRTSIIGPECSARRSESPGLLDWFLRQPKGSRIEGFTECFWSGMSTLELADTIEWALRSDVCGLHHVSRESSISKFGLLALANRVFERDLAISPNSSKYVNKHLIPSRGSFALEATYSEMLLRVAEYIKAHPDLYNY